MNRAVTSKAGFTMVELMLAATLSVIVLMAAGSMILASNRLILRGNRMMEMQRDASLTMNTIGMRIRESRSNTNDVLVTENSASKVTLKLGTESVQWNKSTKKLVLLPKGMELVRTNWTIVNFDAQLTNKYWYVVLQLHDPKTGKQIVMPANFKPRDLKL